MKILIGDIMLAMVSRIFLQVYQFLSVSKNYLPQGTLKILYNSLIETNFRYGNIIWENCEETLLTKASEITKPGSTNNYWFGLRYSSRTFNRTTRVENR